MNNAKKLARAREIRYLYLRRHTIEQLAKEFSLSESSIRRILENQSSYDPTYRTQRKPQLAHATYDIVAAKREGKSNCQIGQEIAQIQNRSRPWSASSVKKIVDSNHFADLSRKCEEVR